MAWIAGNAPADPADAGYRAAAREAGMYGVPEKAFVKVAGGARKAAGGK